MNRPCPLCYSNAKEHLYHQNFYSDVISLMKEYDVVVCKACGFVYADNIPSQEEFNTYYAKMSRYEFSHNNSEVSANYSEHENSLIDFIEPYIKKDSKIVDVGCSTGTLLSLFKKRGYTKLFGVDPSQSCIDLIEKKYSIKGVATTLDKFNSNEKFDVIILSAVIEHLVDIREPLWKLLWALQDGGLLLIEVPDAGRYYQKIFTAFQQFSIEHINYFTIQSIQQLLNGYLDMTTLSIKPGENKGNQTIDPNLLVIAQKNGRLPEYFIHDYIGKPTMKLYIRDCEELEKLTKVALEETLKGKDKVIVWGVGTNTQKLLVPGNGIDISKILYFVDSNTNYTGKKLGGLDIKLPKDIVEPNIPILILSYSYQEEIIKQIRDMGLKNDILVIYKGKLPRR